MLRPPWHRPHLSLSCVSILTLIVLHQSSAFNILSGVPATIYARPIATPRYSNLLHTTITTSTTLFSSPNPEQLSLQPRVELPIPQGYNRVEISYCIGCRWMLRAAWLAQELLTTFQDELHEVAIQPVKHPAGTFEVRLNKRLLFARKAEGRFPEAKEVKQLVRDVINPRRDLGHSDVGEK
ncbi:selw selh selenoprotein [Nannochloropsis oceanica]